MSSEQKNSQNIAHSAPQPAFPGEVFHSKVTLAYYTDATGKAWSVLLRTKSIVPYIFYLLFAVCMVGPLILSYMLVRSGYYGQTVMMTTKYLGQILAILIFPFLPKIALSAINGEKFIVSQLFGGAKYYFNCLLGVVILVVFFVGVSMSTYFLSVFLLPLQLSYLPQVLYIFFILPLLVFFGTKIALWPLILASENTTLFAAFRQSFKLTKHRWLQHFAVLVSLFGILFFVSLIPMVGHAVGLFFAMIAIGLIYQFDKNSPPETDKGQYVKIERVESI